MLKSNGDDLCMLMTCCTVDSLITTALMPKFLFLITIVSGTLLYEIIFAVTVANNARKSGLYEAPLL